MKTKYLILPLAVATLAVTAKAADTAPECDKTKSEACDAVAKADCEPKACETALETQAQKVGYTIGTQIGAGIKQDGLDISLEAFMAGVKDSYSGATAQLTPEQQQATMAALQQEMTEKLTAERNAIAAKFKTEGEAFLTANKDSEGVTTLPSGLQYKVIEEGKGPQPKATDKVTVNYRGTLVDGTEFDNSYSRGEPVTFPVNEVIPGWSEALPLMKAGAKWQLFVPSDLAYGEQGAGGAIPPNATLVFEVELLEVNG